jgi:phosphoribosylformylglycinamidine synthase
LGIIEDVSTAITMDLKEAGNSIYLVGHFAPVFGGSHFSKVTSEINEPVPDLHSDAPKVYKALHNAINEKLIRSAHDISEGGLAVSAAEMCIGGRIGMKIKNRCERHRRFCLARLQLCWPKSANRMKMNSSNTLRVFRV